MSVGKLASCGGRLFLGAGMILLAAQLAFADEGDTGSPVVKDSPGRVEAQEPDDPEAATRAEILDSDAMLEALIWWDEYFSASAEDDEKQREELEARIAKMSVVELRKFLLKFQRERQRGNERRAGAQRSRQQQLGYRHTYLQQQSTRQAALRRSYNGNRRYFGTTQQYYGRAARSPSRRLRAVRPPLITSLSVARYTVYRSLFGRAW